MSGSRANALEVRGLSVGFDTPAGRLTAVDAIDLDVAAGETLGLVGESGSGKSLTLRGILRLIRAPGRVEGSVRWNGIDLASLPERRMRDVRGGEIAMIFQEPMTALNPVLSVGIQIDEVLKSHSTLRRAERRARAAELLALVGIPDAERRLGDYPHQFSGGQRQRAMIAIALAGEPKLLLADEPTTALDVTIQDQILRLLVDLKERLGMGVVLVTHDLGVVAASCERVAVMYAGRIVEVGRVADVFAAPRHAYTLGLIGSVPQAGAERSALASIEGTPPGLASIPDGCAFHPRCRFASTQCRAERPRLAEAVPSHSVACFHQDEVLAARRLAA
ncbi:ABC transporter ATP-binding protein [Aureimonas leprariae]|uniref:ABC transporter ATP-binding protein n=1 Tax=Plantimonas leprariae TaxID=2615207 RepID=A0A7V7PL07_9HYPH|nr:ABC transporter ATP-binding protein [Aureimonas leprariae]KAB0676818.1 ABC transporter ATP-binding protein [Aureimonas leprariae]